MPRISVAHAKKEEVVVMPEMKGRFAGEPTTDDELRAKSGSPVMAAFSAFPSGVHFSGEHDDEEIIILVRAHIVTIVPWLVAVLGGALVPVVVLPVAAVSGIFPQVSFGLGLVLFIFWYLGLLTYASLNLLFWYFNVGIVTNERVVDVDWNSLVHHDVALTLMNQIQDVRAERIGVMTAVFDYGHVHVQTAGTVANVEFYNVPHPQLVVRKIQELMAVEEKEHEPGANN